MRSHMRIIGAALAVIVIAAVASAAVLVSRDSGTSSGTQSVRTVTSSGSGSGAVAQFVVAAGGLPAADIYDLLRPVVVVITSTQQGRSPPRPARARLRLNSPSLFNL